MSANQAIYSVRFRDFLVAGISLAALLAVGAPALLLKREAAREQSCANNLRQVGLHFHYHADRDPQERFCTGATDALHDGSPDIYGWVADVVNHQVADTSILACPNNPARGTETLRDLLTIDQLTTNHGLPPDRLGLGVCGQSRNFEGTKAGTTERKELIASTFIAHDYNTNYTASWFLTRSSIKLSLNHSAAAFMSSDTSQPRRRDQTRGPLTRRWTESGAIVASRVPLLGDGHAIEQPLGVRLDAGDQNRRHLLFADTQLVAAQTGGPHDAASQLPIVLGADLTTQVQAESQGQSAGLQYLQDTRQWQAVHRNDRRQATCNLLMADGSVRTFTDVDGDGLLNPGFASSTTQGSAYATDDCELPAAQVFSGLMLYRIQKSCNFEDGGGSYAMPAFVPAAPLAEVTSSSRFDPIAPTTPISTEDNPTSTFSVDVDTASYSYCRQALTVFHQRPAKDAVRLEEFINYFDYDYQGPVDGKPLHVTATLAQCPWQKTDRLLRVALQAERMNPDERPPASLVFLVDVSGSMNAPNKLPLVQSSLGMLTALLRKDDRVAIVVYAGAAGIVLPPTAGDKKAVIQQAIADLRAGGSTNGSAGLQTAYRLALENLVAGENRVVLCTDGDFNVGVTDTGSIVGDAEKYAAQGIYMTVLGFGGTNLNDSLLENLSNKAGGNYAFIDDEREARKVLQTQLAGTLTTVAKDVKVQLDFHPDAVQTYRLLGYENRALAREDFHNDKKDAGEVGAGHSVTAFYQIKPGKRKSGGAIAKIKLRYKLPDASASEFASITVANNSIPLAETDDAFRLAAAVASFGGKLRGDDAFNAWKYQDVVALAHSQQSSDPRASFLAMVEAARRLSGE